MAIINLKLPDTNGVAPSVDKFVRIESKFLAYRGRIKGIESLLNSYLEPVDGTKTQGYTRVESIYLETPTLDFYNAALLKPTSRLKLRIRKYLNSEEQEVPRFIELKYKKEGISKKKRFRIGEWEENEILEGSTIAVTPHLETLNFQLNRATLYKRVDKLNRIILNETPKMALKVSYDRKAYEGMGLRITIDENLSYEVNSKFLSNIYDSGSRIASMPQWQEGLKMLNNYNPSDLAIIEVKHDGNIPDWLRLGFKNLVLMNDVSMSKYTWSMTKIINEGLICRP